MRRLHTLAVGLPVMTRANRSVPQPGLEPEQTTSNDSLLVAYALGMELAAPVQCGRAVLIVPAQSDAQNVSQSQLPTPVNICVTHGPTTVVN